MLTMLEDNDSLFAAMCAGNAEKRVWRVSGQMRYNDTGKDHAKHQKKMTLACKERTVDMGIENTGIVLRVRVPAQ